MNPAPRKVSGTRLEVRSVPWWLARFLLRAGRPPGELGETLAQIATRVRQARGELPAEVGSG
jgi:hypothetical protein